MNFVTAIADSVGLCKSTVTEKLAKQLEKCVNIYADHTKVPFGGRFLKTGLGRRD